MLGGEKTVEYMVSHKKSPYKVQFIGPGDLQIYPALRFWEPCGAAASSLNQEGGPSTYIRSSFLAMILSKWQTLKSNISFLVFVFSLTHSQGNWMPQQ